MKVICVDDEKILMEDTVAMCRELPEISEVNGFTSAKESLNWIGKNRVNLALLDIDMPDMSGIELAIKIKELSPDTAVIFLTGYAKYAVDAFSIHASGYLMKPITKKTLADEISYVFSHIKKKPKKRYKSRPSVCLTSRSAVNRSSLILPSRRKSSPTLLTGRAAA